VKKFTYPPPVLNGAASRYRRRVHSRTALSYYPFVLGARYGEWPIAKQAGRA